MRRSHVLSESDEVDSGSESDGDGDGQHEEDEESTEITSSVHRNTACRRREVVT